MAATEGSLAVPPGTNRLDTTTVNQTDGTEVHREAVVITDPEVLAARATVTNSTPAGTAYGQVVRHVPSDFMLDVAAGRVTGTTHVNKFGRNAAVVSGGTEEIWDGSAAYVFPATALMTSISQTADQATMRGQVVEIQGLDASWDAVTQNATLNAANTTTVVTLTTALIRVFRMKVLADVVTDQDIRVHNAGETQDYAIILAGNNQTLMAIYTVPNGKTAYMVSHYATVNPGGGQPGTLNVKMWAADRDNSYAKQLKHSLGVSADPDAYGRFQHFHSPYYKFTQKTDIYITATTSGAAADVSAGFDIILEDN